MFFHNDADGVVFVRGGRVIGRLLIAFTLAILAAWNNCLGAEAPPAPVLTLEKALTDRLVSDTTNSPVRHTPLEPSLIRTILKRNLNKDLLAAAPKVSGADFRFIPAGQSQEAQVVLLTLTYPDEKTARRLAGLLAGRNGYFKGTIVFTRFSYTKAGNAIVIVFTESTGNRAITKLIEDFPDLLRDHEH